MTVQVLCQELYENLKSIYSLDSVLTGPVDLKLEEGMLIQLLKDTVETSWGRDILSDNSIHRWLSNFKGDAFPKEYERKLALILAVHMVYYNESDICYLVKIAYRKLLHEIMTKKEKNLEEAVKSIIFCPLGNVSESGSFLSYYFRKENNLPINFFINSENSISNSSTIEDIVFLDDVSISGGQVIRYIKKMKNNDIWNKLLNEKNLYALFLLSTETAKINLKEEGIHLCTPILMDQRSQCFKEESAIYKIFNEDIRNIVRLQSKHMSLVYGYRLLINQYSLNGELQRLLNKKTSTKDIIKKIERDALGYDDSEVLIAFEYNTPNNCLPIIWIESDDWIPLFKRNDKLYTSQVVGGIKNETVYI